MEDSPHPILLPYQPELYPHQYQTMEYKVLLGAMMGSASEEGLITIIRYSGMLDTVHAAIRERTRRRLLEE